MENLYNNSNNNIAFKNIQCEIINNVRRKLFSNIENPMLAQQNAFERIKTQVEGTEINKALKIDKINNVSEFIKKIPVQEFAFFEPYIKRTIDGHYGQLFRGRPVFYLTSSATTGVSKIIPCSNEMFEIFKIFQRELISIMSICSTNISMNSINISLGARPFLKNINSIPQGYLSGILGVNPPDELKNGRFPSEEAFMIEDYSERSLRIYNETKNKDVQMIFGLPCHILNLAHDILNISGKQSLNEIWPNLNVLGYSGTPIENYEQALYNAIGHKVSCVGAYAATEGPMGYEIPEFSHGNHTFTPTPEHVVFSFTDVDHPNSAPLALDELKAGGEYNVNISNMCGLLQYSMKDSIKVISVEPRICYKVLGRKDAVLNIASEKVSQNSILQVIAGLQQKLNKVIDHFFVYPKIYDQKPRYEWILCSDNLKNISHYQLQCLLDELMMEASQNYKNKRLESGAIQSPSVRIVPAYLTKQYFLQGSGQGQFKMKNAFANKSDFDSFWREKIPNIEKYL
ncbi:GH3 family domain-containing protein [Fluviispira sanaruensis]|uniref:Auxin-regulated protein n=1 Tax=Fluviispira sanaruensis TaxID=2493639 RepID=A0A4P2VNT1_FLUSA|nr:GH3 auxin-responsive promoter family protein [Fluviispira sanaruensis]BBH53309.1 auxin-regulated protein [Fluviispira sanaruensis]